MFQAFLAKLKLLLKNPIVIFVYGILSKWYIMVVLTSLVVAYWVLKGLTDAGVLQASWDTVSKAFQDSKSVARYCVPKINDPGAVWECLKNPPDYEASEEEVQLKTGLDSLLNFDNYNSAKDPYSSENNPKTGTTHTVIRKNTTNKDRNSNVNDPGDGSGYDSSSPYDSSSSSESEY